MEAPLEGLTATEASKFQTAVVVLAVAVVLAESCRTWLRYWLFTQGSSVNQFVCSSGKKSRQPGWLSHRTILVLAFEVSAGDPLARLKYDCVWAVRGMIGYENHGKWIDRLIMGDRGRGRRESRIDKHTRMHYNKTA